MKFWVRITADPQHHYPNQWNGPYEDQDDAWRLASMETKNSPERLAELIIQLADGRGQRYVEFHRGEYFLPGDGPLREKRPAEFIPSAEMPKDSAS
jgi:hypothetical protein